MSRMVTEPIPEILSKVYDEDTVMFICLPPFLVLLLHPFLLPMNYARRVPDWLGILTH
jgi:hypothetical protein